MIYWYINATILIMIRLFRWENRTTFSTVIFVLYCKVVMLYLKDYYYQ